MDEEKLNAVIFSVQVAVTTQGREYWAKRPWLSSKLGEDVRDSDVLLLPWEDYREGQPLLFPQGTADFFKELKAKHNAKITVAVNHSKYSELTLHSNYQRIPKAFLTLAVLPVFLGVVANRLDRAIPDTLATERKADGDLAPKTGDLVELEIIVEGQQGKCISVKYKGPSNKLIETVIEQVRECLPQAEQPGR